MKYKKSLLYGHRLSDILLVLVIKKGLDEKKKKKPLGEDTFTSSLTVDPSSNVFREIKRVVLRLKRKMCFSSIHSPRIIGC